MEQGLIFDAGLIRRYDTTGPRYTSYPTALQFHEGFGTQQYRQWARRSNEDLIPHPLSLYIHLPFCAKLCFYCACNKVVTKNRARAQPYLDRLYKEIDLQSELFDRDRKVDQLHWGGGTPTFISRDQMSELMTVTRKHFDLHDDDAGEYSIEIDPREADAQTIRHLRSLGFNRMSLGVQDFEPKVQQAVNRRQTEEETLVVIHAARESGVKSLSVDLIYGLPFQTVETFGRTIEKILDADPDRLSVFNYAHLPESFKPQQRINEADLPEPAEKLAILQHTIERLTAAGYVYIGMDHFAKPDDELAVAQRRGLLYRNFQGYSTHADCDLVGLGITSIGRVGDTYSQNLRTLDDYYARLDAGKLAVFRGVELNVDDRLRRDVIGALMCHFRVEMAPIEERYGIQFRKYFDQELAALAGMEKDELLSIESGAVQVLPKGRLLIRNVAMVFDRYLAGQKARASGSRVI